MGIRESLLNTITSVGNSDFVRIVTSAGASSKATVANLFKSFESGLSAKSSLGTSDYIRVVGSDNNAYKQSVSSVKTAMGIDDIYDKVIPVNLPSTITDLNQITSNSTYIIQGTIPTNAPVSTGTYGAFVRTTQRNSTLSFQEYWKTMSTSGEFEVYARRYINGNWNPWFKLPTRAEVDALNSKLSGVTVTRALNAGTVTFTLGNNYRGTLFVCDSSPQRNGIYMVFSTASGVVDIKPISAGSDLTIDTSATGKITLTATAGSRVFTFINSQGTATV